MLAKQNAVQAPARASSSSCVQYVRLRDARSRRAERCSGIPRATATTADASASPIVRDAPSTEFVRSLSDNFSKGFTSLHNEYAYEATEVEGRIPPELCGTLLRNGPGLFEVGDRKVAQPFDGDGMVCAFAIKDGRVFFRNRFVRTTGLVREQAAGKQLFKSAFNKGHPEGGLGNPFDLTVKNAANTNVVRWGGKTLALYERGLPYRLDSRLRTEGEDSLGGSVGDPPFFAAHYRVVPEADGSQRLVGFSTDDGVPDTRLTLFEYDATFRCLHKTQRVLPGAAFSLFHDMAVSEHYYVLLQNPVSFDVWKFVTGYLPGKASIAECLVMDKAKRVKVILIPRPGKGIPDSPEAMRTFELTTAEPFFTFHHANAYELGAGAGGGPGRYVAVDTIGIKDLDLGLNSDNMPDDFYHRPGNRSVPMRVVVDTQTGQVSRHVLSRHNGEMPSVSGRVAGRPHRHAWGQAALVDSPTTHSPPQVVRKMTIDPAAGVTRPMRADDVSCQFWSPGPGLICQEPVFVPRPGASEEDDGWVLSLVLDTAALRTSLAILDGRDLSRGPLATVRLPHHVPLGLHGSWTWDYLGPTEGQLEGAGEAPHDIRRGL